MDYMWAHTFKTFYRLHDLATNWEQARQICEAEGTSLLVPGSLEEVENIKLLISNMKSYYTAIFIGIHDQFSEGDFVTIRGEPITGSILELLWDDGRPDNRNYSEDCVVMTREGLLDDRPCYDIYPFVCKILGTKSTYNKMCDGFDVGYKLHDNKKCYKFHTEPLSWHDAYLVCMLEEGRLCIINTPEEANFVVSMLGENINNNAPEPEILHIGFSDLMFPFQYRTITGETLEQAGYSSWSPLQEGKRKPKENRCGAISRTGFLQTTSCLNPAMFLCEKLVNNDNKATP
ncbi:unnamed protein product [Parnassius apollo]|uniref:(apollo) hypothetical protein n=1 Tax=Parnassius apollo TaxID=110799 RepID=A0A8S3WU42_PARAO|nr:unnamed protein product [Parnassius apollo]